LQSDSFGGLEFTAGLALPATSGTITGASPSAGLHGWWGPDGSRFILGGYLSANYTFGQNPPGTSTNFGGNFTIAPELHLGGRDSDHSLFVVGGNFGVGYNQFLNVSQTGAGGASVFPVNPVTLTGSLNVTLNPAYYPGSKVPYVSIYAEGSGGGIVNGTDATGAAASTRFGAVGGGVGGNFRLSGSTIFTVGAAGGFRWQGDTAGSGTVPASGPFFLGTAGVAWY